MAHGSAHTFSLRGLTVCVLGAAPDLAEHPKCVFAAASGKLHKRCRLRMQTPVTGLTVALACLASSLSVPGPDKRPNTLFAAIVASAVLWERTAKVARWRTAPSAPLATPVQKGPPPSSSAGRCPRLAPLGSGPRPTQFPWKSAAVTPGWEVGAVAEEQH